MHGLRARAASLKADLAALAVAARDPRTPWIAKALMLVVLAYAFSPIDLVPDPIPVLGLLDDLILLPLGIALAIRLIPAGVMADARAVAHESGRDRSWLGAGIVVLAWLALLLIGYLLVGAAR